MSCYSYIIPRDYGFAPNPFYGKCTLATCKPGIRKVAEVKDWVIGTGSASYGESGFLVFAMQVDIKLHFDDYWKSKEFRCKRPIMNGSLKQMYGDNIYHYDNSQGKWIQEDSHHSKEDGTENESNKKRDLGSEHVLVSSHFWYFGGKPLRIPERFRTRVCHIGRNYLKIYNEDLIGQFISWIQTQAKQGYKSEPRHFTSFKRYRGER